MKNERKLITIEFEADCRDIYCEILGELKEHKKIFVKTLMCDRNPELEEVCLLLHQKGRSSVYEVSCGIPELAAKLFEYIELPEVNEDNQRYFRDWYDVEEIQGLSWNNGNITKLVEGKWKVIDSLYNVDKGSPSISVFKQRYKI